MDARQQNKSTKQESHKWPLNSSCLGLVSDHILLAIISIQLKTGSGICVIN